MCFLFTRSLHFTSRPLFRIHKPSKLAYYFKAILRLIVPNALYRKRLPAELDRLTTNNAQLIFDRINYYNKLTVKTALHPLAPALKDYTFPKKQKVYFFDSQEYFRYFKRTLRVHFLPGDITHVPDEPTIVKSRPLHESNENAVLLKLNKVRHFVFVTDTKPFTQKKNMLVGRGVVKVPHRIRFFEQYFNHPLCNLGQINHGKNEQWIKPKLTIQEHLDYKFILCLEGYDVATNLKWVMSSGSLAVMPEPKFESWFMEGRLIPGYHYIKIQADYSDLESQLTYYIAHTDEALAIVRNANAWVQQFSDKKSERLISLMVLEKYFNFTGQQ
jgi:hypothetical protein